MVYPTNFENSLLQNHDFILLILQRKKRTSKQSEDHVMVPSLDASTYDNEAFDSDDIPTKKLKTHSYIKKKDIRRILKSVPNSMHSESDFIKDLFKSHQGDLHTALNDLCSSEKYVGKHSSDLGHFPQFSFSTQLEREMLPDTQSVKKAYVQNWKQWMQDKHLDKVVLGKSVNTTKIADLPFSEATERTRKECLEDFSRELYHLMRGGEPEPDESGVYPVPNSTTEESVNQVS